MRNAEPDPTSCIGLTTATGIKPLSLPELARVAPVAASTISYTRWFGGSRVGLVMRLIRMR
jgi:hypothetical protein